MKKKWLTVLAVSLLIAGIAVGSKQILAAQKDKTLTKSEAIESAEAKYAGNVKKIALHDDIYEIDLENTLGKYHVRLSKDTGNILDLSLVEKQKGNENDQEGLPEPKIDEQQAKKIALDRMDDNGKISKIHLIMENGIPVYKVHAKSNKDPVELTVNGNNGNILFYEQEENDQEDEAQTNETEVPQTLISVEEAKKIALSEVPGSIDDVDKEESDGSFVYEVEIETNEGDVEVVIQAFTGEVLSVTFEDDDDDD